MTESRVERVLHRLKIDARPAGRHQWKAICPNPAHDDRHPSWRIVDDPGGRKDGYHSCKACGFGGGLVKLVEVVLKLENGHAAREWLAGDADAGLVLEEAPTLPLQVKPVRKRFSIPVGVEFIPYDHWPHMFRDYLEGRGVTRGDVEQWGLGFAMVGRLKWRVVLAVRDSRGNPLSYSARAVTKSMQPKYMTPDGAEEPVPWAIFGEQFWPESAMARKERTLVVTEGGFNAMAVRRAMGGHVDVAAVEGSDPRAEKVLRLMQFGSVVILTDSDPAGDRVAESLRAAMSRHVGRVARARAIDGQDADEMDPRDLQALILGAMRI